MVGNNMSEILNNTKAVIRIISCESELSWYYGKVGETYNATMWLGMWQIDSLQKGKKIPIVLRKDAVII